MKTLDIQQDTPEWHQLRRECIGASDIPKILGLNPWDDICKLFAEKKGLGEQRSSAAMERGKALEPLARECLGRLHSCFYEPIVAQHDEYPWMIASMDAVTLRHGYVFNAAEIKCSLEKTHYDYMSGIIPEYVYAQVQWQMHVCGLEQIIVFAYHDDSSHNAIEVMRDQPFIDNAVIAAKEFYRRMVEFDPPEPKHKLMDGVGWEMDSMEYRNICVEEEFLSRRKKECKERLIAYSGEKNAKGFGVTLTKVIRPGPIIYNVIPELEGVDLDKYRSDPIEYWTITKDKS